MNDKIINSSAKLINNFKEIFTFSKLPNIYLCSNSLKLDRPKGEKNDHCL